MPPPMMTMSLISSTSKRGSSGDGGAYGGGMHGGGEGGGGEGGGGDGGGLTLQHPSQVCGQTRGQGGVSWSPNGQGAASCVV